ncbi:MAG: SPOR domain-containing protein [Legionellaceae bacterium]|nr:SPOR domain-containing protein [Legionellaceae bacterium]
MNISIDERTKHRLTGLVVILAVAIIFVPAMVKKSNQRLEENIHLSIQLPPKPSEPKIAVADKQAVFETVKIAEVTLPVTKKPVHVSQIARAEGLQLKTPEKKHVPVLNKPVVAKTKIKQPMATIKPKPVKLVQTPPKPVVTPVNLAKLEKDMTQAYAVQLASFSSQDNAEKLVYHLRDHGYKAQYHASTQGNNALYKVIVGQLDDRDDAHALKEKLSESLQLHGFVVKRGVRL